MGRVGSVEAHVGAAPEAVFAVITDPVGLPRWNRHIARTLDHPTHLEEGAEWVVQMHIYGQRFPSRSRVLTLDAEARRFEYQSSPDGDPDFSIWSWEVAPDGIGSRVRVTWDLNPKQFLNRMFFAPLRARGLPRDVAASLTSLEKFVTTLEHARLRSPKSLRSFVETLTDRDFETMRKLFASDVRLRALVPAGLKESDGPASVVDRFRSWFGSAQQFEVVESRVERVADRWHVAYRLLIERGNGRELVEQHVLCDVGADGIEKIDLVCSGFRPEPSSQRSVHEFDAGEMGCADGLPHEFRRRIRTIPVGEKLVVIARDPAAKEDLPALARMLGHKVLSVETQEDGRLVINVEVSK